MPYDGFCFWGNELDLMCIKGGFMDFRHGG